MFYVSLFVERGYLTGFSEDSPRLGAFQYRLMGFRDQPTDFYTRPFFQRAELILNNGNNPEKCLGSRSVAKCQFDYILDIFRMYKKKLKFFFSFNGILTVFFFNKKEIKFILNV